MTTDTTTTVVTDNGSELAPAQPTATPNPDNLRGVCPSCKQNQLVSKMGYFGGRGYLIVWTCLGSRGDNPTCDYRRVL